MSLFLRSSNAFNVSRFGPILLSINIDSLVNSPNRRLNYSTSSSPPSSTSKFIPKRFDYLHLSSSQRFGSSDSSKSSSNNFRWGFITAVASSSLLAFYLGAKKAEMSPSKETVSKKRTIEGENGKDAKRPTNAVDSYRRNPTTFSDPVLGLIELNPAIVSIIQTEQFDRLRSIKQTGCLDRVYPSAMHTRLAHSLGTCYLAGQVMERLRTMQPELEITDLDILVVEIAALVHDIGHGPFSHMLDVLIPLARPGCDWVHEDASIAMFRWLLEANPHVKAYLDELGMKENDYKFIEEAIKPVDESKHVDWPYEGRPKKEAFMYDIVSNKANSFDVDKMDYIVRDSYHMSIKTNANFPRLLKNMRVFEIDGRPTICYRDKVSSDLKDLACTRADLHLKGYQHETAKRIEIMMVDAMLIANDHLKFTGKDGRMLCLSEVIYDMKAYEDATDETILSDIKRSTSPEMAEAREIIERIKRRKLYDKVEKIELTCERDLAKVGNGICTKTSREIADRLDKFKDEFPDIDKTRLERSLAIMITDIHGGMKSENPVSKVYFFEKDHGQPRRLTAQELEDNTPSRRRKVVLAFCRKQDGKLIECAKKCFADWIEWKFASSRTSTESEDGSMDQ